MDTVITPTPADVERLHPLMAFGLGSAAGLAALLRSKAKLTWRTVAASLLYNGLASMAAAWVLEDRLHGSPGVLAGVCVLSGIGGASVLDVVVAGVRVTLGPGQGQAKG